MKVFITKYALTKGIQEFDAVECDSKTGMIEVKKTSCSWSDYFHGEGRDWHRTRESAVKRAEAMKLDKILALNRQIRKLSEMEFGKGNA